MADPLRRVHPLRLRHAHGEALRRHDLADQAAQDDQLRWWHNRALHQAYGISSGLGVTVAGGVATVEPGVAYDRRGRELVLAAPLQVPVPPGEPRHLVIEHRAGGVAVCWLAPDAVTCSDGIRLDGEDTSVPRQVRPIARPRIGRGSTIPGRTAWRPWVLPVDAERELRLGIQVGIDTAATGFTATPCYFAQVTGSTWDARMPMMLLIPFDHIAEQGRDGFTFRLVMPWLHVRDGFPDLARFTNLAVTWIGIQHRIEGQP
jgi:hypothetical protein